MWTLLPLISLDSDFVDPLENIVWGSHFQFGYDKNPYLGAWLGYYLYKLSGDSTLSVYLMGQILVFTGIFSTWRLARKLLSEPMAALAASSLIFINFYGIKSVELCDDVIELGLWPVTILFFYKALTEKHPMRDWLICGFFCGCDLMVKYYAPFLFVPMAVILLFTEEGRRAWKSAPIYLAGCIVLLMSLPNILWLFSNDMVTIRYAFGRGGVSDQQIPFTDHLINPWKSLQRAAGVFGVQLAAFALCFFRRGETTPRQSFNTRFLWLMTLGPFGLTLLFSLISGSRINYSWVLPCFSCLGIACFYFWQPKISSWNVRLHTVLLLVMALMFGTIFLVRSTYFQGYVKKKCDYENYPGREIALILTKEWHRRFNSPLPYVVAERQESCFLAIYSPDHPEAFFAGNISQSQWIDPKDVLRKGAVLVCDDDLEAFESLITLLPKERLTEIVSCEIPRAVPAWFRKFAGEPKKCQYSYCFLKPESELKSKTGPAK